MSSRRGKPRSPRGLEQRVLQRWRALNLPPGPSIMVGFSGGPDSLALAACVAALQPLLAADIRLIHIDHGLRPTSSVEAGRARELAAGLGLSCQVMHIDTAALERHLGVGVEESARRERYECFRRVVADNDNAVFALGHHQMDQAETVLLHLLRGAGPRGVAGMTEFSEITVPWWASIDTPVDRVRVWRPFLSEPRNVVHDYLAHNRLEPILDDSNMAVVFQRNAIRHRLLPVMEEVSPGAIAAIGRFAAIASEEDRYLEAQAGGLLDAARSGPTSLSVEPFACASSALRRRAILLWLGDFEDLDPTQDRVERLSHLIERRRRGATIEIGGGYTATISGDELSISRD